jgi:hypothetical protein
VATGVTGRSRDAIPTGAFVSIVGRRRGALWRDCGDRVIVLLPAASDPLMLNGLARLLWLATEAPADPDELAADVVAVLPESDREAVADALGRLLDRGVLEPAT